MFSDREDFDCVLEFEKVCYIQHINKQNIHITVYKQTANDQHCIKRTHGIRFGTRLAYDWQAMRTSLRCRQHYWGGVLSLNGGAPRSLICDTYTAHPRFGVNSDQT